MVDISVAGDAILDEYVTCGSRKSTPVATKRIWKPGGADNVVQNLWAIAPRLEVTPSTSPQNVLTRYIINGQTQLIWNCFRQHTPAQVLYQGTVGIYSDYGHGFLSNVGMSPKHVVAIVDSKYRTLDKKVLQRSKLKIWRCTGDEYDKTWGRDFDYIVHTDGPNTITLLAGDGTELADIQVPSIQVIDTCGAGDTFTAALGAHLHAPAVARVPDLQDIIDACEFAIRAAQDVCVQDLTSVTRIRL